VVPKSKLNTRRTCNVSFIEPKASLKGKIYQKLDQLTSTFALERGARLDQSNSSQNLGKCFNYKIAELFEITNLRQLVKETKKGKQISK
jgi:hypothetical protein